ncbi:MAG: flagellar biosynthesis anti-sigma factor FlgM [Bacillota bacterium]|nr:flagellar biosynthesis anti-sigma factor FlgM [Bacillota bacterium]
MKINSINSIYKNNMTQSENINKNIKKDNSNKDTIKISDMAKKIHQISSGDDLEQNKKIEELKKSINNRTYKVDTQKLAEKIYQALKESKNE